MAGRALGKKLVRDLKQNAMQFLSIALLCALGTFIFAGLCGVADMAQGTIDVYFAENNLADLWLTASAVDRDMLNKVRSVPGVAEVCARSGVKLETTLPGKPKLTITGYDGPMTVNVPIVEAGEALSVNDLRGCLVQAGFAKAHGLGVGDRLSVSMGGETYHFLIRGTVYSPEYILVTEGTYPNPNEYGYILINAASMPQLPLYEMVVTLDESADADAVKAQLQKALPGVLVLDRAAHPSTASAVGNASMFRGLLLVFPVLAYAVAALVVMTTLTRMIDNQRLQIGTLKSLGYSERSIRRHYLAYAVWPSVTGSLAGAVVGHLTLPRLVWALLIGQNEYPYRIYPHISPLTWGMAALTVVMSVGICAYTYRKSGRETTAELLRPKPPKAGKRILLERITPLWKRLGFNAKMMVRSLSRSPMRTLLSFVGILCCNALIIASFGMQDSVNILAEKHYGETLSYDLRANLTGQGKDASAYRRLEAERTECIMETSVSMQSDSAMRTTLLTVTEDDQTLLRLGKNSTYTELLPGGIIITEKMAKTLGVKVGDALILRFPGEKDAETETVVQIVYNNVQQGAYMTRSAWEARRKSAFVPTALLIKGPTDACLARLDGMDEVDTLDRPSEQGTDLTDMLELVSSMFLILMALALALAFVICYNMGLMNFSERTREYATLKVLGYHMSEIRGLIVGENNAISLLAIAASIYPGIGLTRLVLTVCQTETLTYPSQTRPASVAIACGITYAFSLLIQLFLTRKVKSIDMVEALKSVE